MPEPVPDLDPGFTGPTERLPDTYLCVGRLKPLSTVGKIIEQRPSGKKKRVGHCVIEQPFSWQFISHRLILDICNIIVIADLSFLKLALHLASLL
jgi:hypothetical protein